MSISLKLFRNKLKYFALDIRREKINLCWSLCTSSKIHEFWPWRPSDFWSSSEKPTITATFSQQFADLARDQTSRSTACSRCSRCSFNSAAKGFLYQGKAPAKGRIQTLSLWLRNRKTILLGLQVASTWTQSGVMFHNSLIRVVKRFTNNNYSFECFIPKCNQEKKSTLTWLHTAQRNRGTEKLNQLKAQKRLLTFCFDTNSRSKYFYELLRVLQIKIRKPQVVFGSVSSGICLEETSFIHSATFWEKKKIHCLRQWHQVRKTQWTTI